MSDSQSPGGSWSRGTALAAGLLLAACGGGSPTNSTPAAPTPAPAPSAVVVLTAGTFDGAVASGVSLVEFYHPSCSHCRAMEPVVEQLATDFQGRALVGKVNVTTEPALTAAWGVRAYPAFFVLRDGQEHSDWLGETSYDQLAALIHAALGAS